MSDIASTSLGELPPRHPAQTVPAGETPQLAVGTDAEHLRIAAEQAARHPRAARLVRGLDGVAHACLVFCGVLLVAMIFAYAWLVFGRYVLNDTPTWVEQFSLVVVAYITLIGGAVGVWRRTHLSIDFVREALPRPLAVAMRPLADLAVCTFGVLMTWQGWVLVSKNTTRAIPMLHVGGFEFVEAWRYFPLIVGGGLIVVFAAAELGLRFVGFKRTV